MWKAIAGALAPVVLLPIVMAAGFGSTAPSVRSGVVPAAYETLVATAGEQCPVVTAAVIAAQIDTESSWNPTALSPAGAQGIAQFMPATWASWGRDENGDATAEPFDPADAIAAQALLPDGTHGAESASARSRPCSRLRPATTRCRAGGPRRRTRAVDCCGTARRHGGGVDGRGHVPRLRRAGRGSSAIGG